MSASIDRIVESVFKRSLGFVDGFTPADNDNDESLSYGDWKDAIGAEHYTMKSSLEEIAQELDGARSVGLRAEDSPDYQRFMIGFPKPIPRVLVKEKRKSEANAEDRRQRTLCKLRSGGRCEVVTVTPKPETSTLLVNRCKAKAVNNHHLLGGNGRRNTGDSILAVHRLDVCSKCHQLLHAKVLQAIDRDWQYDAQHVRFELVPR